MDTLIKEAVLSVSDLNHQAKHLLESEFPNIWVEGEISNLARPASGHIYFTLKDEKAQVRCAMFRMQKQQLSFAPENGMQVKLKGKVSLFEGRGDFQLIASRMVPDGEGALQQAYEVLKRKLAQAGYFDPEAKLPLPEYPENLGVITSETGAVIEDIIHVIQRRCPSLHINIYPTQVQGKQAAPQIIRAIDLAIKHNACDVLIIARGGGSLEDLWAFNEESVAEAIYNCPIPIVSAIGHETDVTISDFVADVRAPTPSAAAELITPDLDDLLEVLESHLERLLREMERILENKAQTFDYLVKRLQHPAQKIEAQRNTLDLLLQNLCLHFNLAFDGFKSDFVQAALRLQNLSPMPKIKQRQHSLFAQAKHMHQTMLFKLSQAQQTIISQSRTLDTVSPLATIGRGYAVITAADTGKLITSIKHLNKTDRFIAKLKDGEIEAIVE